MRFIRDISSTSRIRTKYSYRPRTYYSRYQEKKEPNQDTIIRKDIYRMVTEMINENESNIKIECIIREKYPEYAEYIANLINDQFIKRGLNTQIKREDKSFEEDER